MSHDLRGKTAAVILGICLVALGGCASSRSSKFYSLSPLDAPGKPPGSVPTEQRIVVAVGPVAIPDYLDRPQILTRSGPSELQLAEFERWAGSLEKDVSRVLAENLSTLLEKDHVIVLRSGPDVFPLPVGYRVGIDVMRFEGDIGKSVHLAARWSVLREEEGKVLTARESNIREPVEGPGYDALVGAMSRALAVLSREIAEAIPAR